MLTTMISAVLAQPALEPTDDMVSWGLGVFKWIAEQFASKNYAAAIAGIVMVLVFALKLVLKEKLKSDALPMVSAGLGLALSLAGALSGAKVDMSVSAILGIVLAGLTTGALASGFWSLAGKRIVDFIKAKFSRPAVVEAPVAPAVVVPAPEVLPTVAPVIPPVVESAPVEPPK